LQVFKTLIFAFKPSVEKQTHPSYPYSLITLMNINYLNKGIRARFKVVGFSTESPFKALNGKNK